MADIINLTQAIRQPYVRVTGTSYPLSYATAVKINNTPANLLAALPRFPMIGDSVRVLTQDDSTGGPKGVSILSDGSASISDTPYDLEATDIGLRLVACGAAISLNDLRVLNDGSFEVDAFYKTFIADGIRARVEQQLINGSASSTEFNGLMSLAGIWGDPADNTDAQSRINSIEIMADQCARGRGVTRCDALVMTTAARRKLRADCRATDTEWRNGSSDAYAMVSLAQGWTSIIVSDFIPGSDDDTTIFGLVLKGENACAWASPRGMENVYFTAARDPQKAQNWLIGETLGALIVQDTSKVAKLTGYNAS